MRPVHEEEIGLNGPIDKLPGDNPVYAPGQGGQVPQPPPRTTSTTRAQNPVTTSRSVVRPVPTTSKTRVSSRTTTSTRAQNPVTTSKTVVVPVPTTSKTRVSIKATTSTKAPAIPTSKPPSPQCPIPVSTRVVEITRTVAVTKTVVKTRTAEITRTRWVYDKYGYN